MSSAAATSIHEPELREAVRTSTTMADVLRKVGVLPQGGNYEIAWKWMRIWGIEANHIRRGRGSGRNQVWSYSDEQLADAVAGSKSLAQAMRQLGCTPRTSGYRRINSDIARLGLDTGHMTGRLWSKGQRLPRRKLAKDVFVKGRLQFSGALRDRIIDDGMRPRRCESCGGRRWLGTRIPLELDHVNGDKTDNRLGNLRLLCPNCHALTPTYRGRNIGVSANGRMER